MVYKYADCHANQDKWHLFIQALNSGEKVEMDERLWYYFLEVLPPIFMGEEIDYFPGHEGTPTKVKSSFGFAEGCEPIKVFWREDGRFYGQRSKKINRLS